MLSSLGEDTVIERGQVEKQNGTILKLRMSGEKNGTSSRHIELASILAINCYITNSLKLGG